MLITVKQHAVSCLQAHQDALYFDKSDDVLSREGYQNTFSTERNFAAFENDDV